MPASFSLTQRFETVLINGAGGALPRTVYAATSDGTYINIDLRGARLPDDQQQRDDLAQLQAIYASADGFRNSAGQPIDIKLSDTLIANDVDDLERYGAFNPLSAGSIERYQSMLRRLDGAVAQGGSPVIRHANWTGDKRITDEVTHQQGRLATTGYPSGGELSYEYIRLSNTDYNSAQVRVESQIAPNDCLWQALVSNTDQAQWGWFMGIATTFRGWQAYPWSSYVGGIVIRFDWNGDVIMLHAGQTDGGESNEPGIASYAIPRQAGWWQISAGARALTDADSPSARYRNAAFRLDNRVTGRKYGFALECFGHFLDVIQDGQHIARWTWTQQYNPFRDGRERGRSYVIRGNGGNAWRKGGILRTPDTRLYAYSLSTGRNSAVAPGYFI